MQAEIATRHAASRHDRPSAITPLRADATHEDAVRGATAGVPVYLRSRSPSGQTAKRVKHATNIGGDVAEHALQCQRKWRRAAAVLEASPHAKAVRTNWRERTPRIVAVFDQANAR